MRRREAPQGPGSKGCGCSRRAISKLQGVMLEGVLIYLTCSIMTMIGIGYVDIQYYDSLLICFLLIYGLGCL